MAEDTKSSSTPQESDPGAPATKRRKEIITDDFEVVVFEKLGPVTINPKDLPPEE